MRNKKILKTQILQLNELKLQPTRPLWVQGLGHSLCQQNLNPYVWYHSNFRKKVTSGKIFSIRVSRIRKTLKLNLKRSVREPSIFAQTLIPPEHASKHFSLDKFHLIFSFIYIQNQTIQTSHYSLYFISHFSHPLK